MSNQAIVRKAHKKALPYTITDIGDKAALAHWKAEQARIEKEWEDRRNRRVAKACKAFDANAAKYGYDIYESQAKRKAEYDLLKSIYSYKPTLLQKVGRFFTRLWKNANF